MLASQIGGTETVVRLLRARANLELRDTRGRTALLRACASRVNEITAAVETLLNAGARIDAADENGQTALMLSSSRGMTNTVEVLLECGPEALRAQKALLRQWEELPLTESVNRSIAVFGQSFLSGEPQRMMQQFIDRKR